MKRITRKRTVRDDLIKEVWRMRRMAYARYSKFRVGAALLGEDDTIYPGCNIENISFGLTNCAERTAVFKAISEGVCRFKAIAISSPGPGPTYPCGACRQVLAEFWDLEVYVDKDPFTHKLSKLIPHQFNEIK